ncbi:cysteine proteinase inhibitor 1-like [Rhododendron vialii]|uniref:cysteine proteinase inhibitor 1-like n=1 Tax=Rhododendron vialii TaxID=182163 RepID=UPI00265F9DD6|nr:cysteine proteinase inhibitor 1-like [Rhododendron vialii]
MTLKSQSLILLLSLLSPFLLSAAALGGNQASTPLGGWQPIENVSAPEVIETAQFAVAEHNKKADSTLKFRSVVRGEYQVVAGMNYRLIIAAKDGGVAGKYEAVVYVRPWEHYKSLTSFTKV